MQRYNGEMLFEAIVRDIYLPKITGPMTASDKKAREAGFADIKAVQWPSVMKTLDKFLPKDKKFINGDKMT
jgi:hypothetical protein